MQRDNPRLAALQKLTASSVAYFEALDKHGESGAVAACADLFNQYHTAASSKEYIAATPKRSSTYVPESGLDPNNLDRFFKKLSCAGKFEACKKREVTDADVRALVKKAGRPQPSPALPIASTSFQAKSSGTQLKLEQVNKFFRTGARKESQPPQPSGSRNIEMPRAATSSKPTMLDQINESLNNRRSAPATAREAPRNFQRQPPVVQTPRVPAVEAASAGPSDRSHLYPDFRTSTAEYHLQQSRKHAASGNQSHSEQPPQKKRLGMHAVNAPYKSPVIQQPTPVAPMQVDSDIEEAVHPLLKGIDPKLIEQIKLEVVNNGKPVEWDDIAGLEEVKTSIKEAVTLPLMHPWLFKESMLKLEKGILLFGPPGTGKTLIAKCVAAQSQATFFNLSASALTSKWIGEGEKLVKTLFTYAKVMQPSVIFIDEIDSILTKRGDSDHESSTRLKTEFMIQIDGANSSSEDDRILLIGATNRPHTLDDAVVRRFTKRFYIPLPDLAARAQLLTNLLKKESRHKMTAEDILRIAELTEGYSGDDLTQVGSKAAYYRVRELCLQGRAIERDIIRPVAVNDFLKALKEVKASVNQEDLKTYTDWSNKMGSN